jgi:hypothetical protein
MKKLNLIETIGVVVYFGGKEECHYSIDYEATIKNNGFINEYKNHSKDEAVNESHLSIQMIPNSKNELSSEQLHSLRAVLFMLLRSR